MVVWVLFWDDLNWSGPSNNMLTQVNMVSFVWRMVLTSAWCIYCKRINTSGAVALILSNNDPIKKVENLLDPMEFHYNQKK